MIGYMLILRTTMVISFNQELLLCIIDGLVIVTGMNSVGTYFLSYTLAKLSNNSSSYSFNDNDN